MSDKLKPSLSNLIQALQIFLKYGDRYKSTHCEHDLLTLRSVHPREMSPEDVAQLNRLNFHYFEAAPGTGLDSDWYSHGYGSGCGIPPVDC